MTPRPCPRTSCGGALELLELDATNPRGARQLVYGCRRCQARVRVAGPAPAVELLTRPVAAGFRR